MADILIIEDSPINRSFLRTLLQGHGHRVWDSSDDEEALGIIRAGKPDVVFIDVLAPGFDGCEFVTKMRADPGPVPPRVVFRAAACIETEARTLANAFGAFFVAKPVNPEALLAVVNAAISGRPPAQADRGLEPGCSDALLRLIARKLQGYAADLERLNAHLDRGIVERNERLEMARSALDHEIRKRLWAEQELTQANLRWRDQAIRDGLTGLHNRRYLEESLDREESRARRAGQPFGVIMIDIDGFKLFNDTLGHAAGDAVLCSMSKYMASAARGEDIVSRYGGDEFVLVMSQASQGALWERAERLRLGAPKIEIEHEGRRIGRITLSMGIGVFPDHGETGKAVLRVADDALYLAKHAGRNRVVMGDKVKA